MRTISDTIARLTALREKQGLPASGGSIDRLSDLPAFGSDPGALRARTYIPQGLRAGAPLVVVLHGCTQTAAGYDHGSGWSRLADRHGFALLFPEQQRSNNPNLCFNWFAPDDTGRDGGEALSIRQMIGTLIDAQGLDERRIFITGLSAGGAMAAVMLAVYPEIFAGGAIIAGLPYGCARTIPEAFDRMRGHGLPGERQLQATLREASGHAGPWPKLSVWQGDADATVSPANAAAIVAQWRGVHGLGAKPAQTENAGIHRRDIWKSPDGQECVELHTIAGMGHGTPLATGGKQGLGVAGPFMLDVGISSTLQIARFWGLASAPDATARTADSPPARPAETKTGGASKFRATTPKASAKSETPASGPHGDKPSRPQPQGSIGKTIEDALRKAGLMR